MSDTTECNALDTACIDAARTPMLTITCWSLDTECVARAETLGYDLHPITRAQADELGVERPVASDDAEPTTGTGSDIDWFSLEGVSLDTKEDVFALVVLAFLAFSVLWVIWAIVSYAGRQTAKTANFLFNMTPEERAADWARIKAEMAEGAERGRRERREREAMRPVVVYQQPPRSNGGPMTPAPLMFKPVREWTGADLDAYRGRR